MGLALISGIVIDPGIDWLDSSDQVLLAGMARATMMTKKRSAVSRRADKWMRVFTEDHFISSHCSKKGWF